MRTNRHGPARLLMLLALLLCAAIALGCNSNMDGQDGLRGEGMKTNKISDIVELAPQGSTHEYTEPDADARGSVSVSLPKGYDHSESVEAYEAVEGTQIELSTMTVHIGDQGFDLQITVDDAGYLDWWCNGAVVEYIEQASTEPLNSSWPICVDGREGVVLIQGSAYAGGEISGDAFVFLDGATIWFSAVAIEGKASEVNAYSNFFSSSEICDLFDRISLSE
jgi:hypothetical protein